MAGLNKIQREFEAKTGTFHITSPDGLPLYAVLKKDKITHSLGAWDKKRNPVPPVVKGAEVKPALLVLRNPQSPDAIRYLEENGVKGHYTEDGNGDPLDPKLIDELYCAACIAEFQNVYFEDDAGNPIKLVRDDKTALDFIQGFPSCRGRLVIFLNTPKNFMGLDSLTG